MASYKVPQDVEADDKLIGPFSFRQFIYLIIVAMAGALAYGLAQIFIGLAIIPLPIILLFGALALPLRKDQPMEIYLAALVSFYLKPHRRLWDPDGVDSLIEITVPKTIEAPLTKGLSQADADQRFSYLASIVDTQGWAIRGDGAQPQSMTMNSDVFLEAQSAQDILDTTNSIGQTFDAMMDQRSEQIKQEAMERMHMTAPAEPVAAPAYNPYPAIQQAVVQPVDDPAHQYVAPIDEPADQPATQTPTTTSDKPVSADIMNLANNTDLSIETIAHEAHRIQEKENDMSEEVVISLR